MRWAWQIKVENTPHILITVKWCASKMAGTQLLIIHCHWRVFEDNYLQGAPTESGYLPDCTSIVQAHNIVLTPVLGLGWGCVGQVARSSVRADWHRVAAVSYTGEPDIDWSRLKGNIIATLSIEADIDAGPAQGTEQANYTQLRLFYGL